MLLVRLDDASREPKTAQIIKQVRRLIESGALLPKEALPSTRALANTLGVHRSTVATAYQELWALGFVDIPPRSCPRVRERVQISTATGRPDRGRVNWDAVASPASGILREAHRSFRSLAAAKDRPSVIDFSALDSDLRLLPLDRFRSCLDQVLRESGRDLLAYGDIPGYPPLRDYIARRLESHAIEVSPDEILITNGSQQALDLVFRMIGAPGRKVVVESPTYDRAIPLLRFNGLVPVEVPMRSDGMDLSVLARVLEEDRPALVYTMPSFQNPTGVSTPQSHREVLLRLCERHGVPILEDGFDEEMKYFGRAVLPLKSMDMHSIVIYCGTFSKVLFPGMRVGWIAADKECVDRLAAIRRFGEISPNLMVQAAFHQFCARGYYDRHITMMHRVYRKRMQAFIDAMRRHVSPEWADWDEPAGGYLAWLRLKPCLQAPAGWARHFEAHGVAVALGGGFFSGTMQGMQLRLSIARLNSEEIASGVERLGAALRDLAPRSHA